MNWLSLHEGCESDAECRQPGNNVHSMGCTITPGQIRGVNLILRMGL